MDLAFFFNSYITVPTKDKRVVMWLTSNTMELQHR
jgi:hypothetical protein